MQSSLLETFDFLDNHFLWIRSSTLKLVCRSCDRFFIIRILLTASIPLKMSSNRYSYWPVLSKTFDRLRIIIIVIIITSFQDDNIFGTNAILTYGPQIQRHTCVDNYWKKNENYLQYVQSRRDLRTPSMLRAATQPYWLGGGGGGLVR